MSSDRLDNNNAHAKESFCASLQYEMYSSAATGARPYRKNC